MTRLGISFETNEFRQFAKSFGQAFSKACAVEVAQTSSPSAEGEISTLAFLFVSFFFAPLFCKEKATKKFYNIVKRKPRRNDEAVELVM